MHPTRDNDGSPYSNFFWSRSKVGDDGHLTVVSSNSLTDNCLPYSILALWLTQVLEQLCAVRVGVWIAMRHINFIIVVLKLHLESKCVIETSSFLLQRILEITNVLSISIPSDALSIIAVRHLFRVNKRLHTLVVRTLRFYQIHKIELVSCEFLCVLNSKIKPLSISSCVMVILKNEIILIFTNLDSSSKVSRFKATLEYQGVIILVFLLVICLELTVVPINLGDLGIKIWTLPRWPIRIVFSVVHWILFRWQFNQIVFINIGRGVSLTFGSWEVYAVEHYFLSLRGVVQ